jgi:hypothetical protein
MRRLVSVTAFLAIFGAVSLAAQQEQGPPVYRVNYVQVLDSDYYTYLREVLYPVYDEFIKMGLIKSYDGLRQGTGAGEVSMLGVTEFPNWDIANDINAAAYAEASQAAHGKPWSEATEGYTLSELRKIIRTELYWSIKQ